MSKNGHINGNERNRREKEKTDEKEENENNIKTAILYFMIVFQRRTALFVDDRDLLLLLVRFLSGRALMFIVRSGAADAEIRSTLLRTGGVIAQELFPERALFLHLH